MHVCLFTPNATQENINSFFRILPNPWSLPKIKFSNLEIDIGRGLEQFL
jgi:hypothetical protein